MQTFLPYPNFESSAKVLDNARLNKQIVECQQILMVLHGDAEGHKNHPVMDMWRDDTQCLCYYGLVMFEEYKQRTGKKKHKSSDTILSYFNWNVSKDPWWLGYKELHQTHQSRLMHKGNVDVLKTRFGKGNEQKRNYLSFRDSFAPEMPKEWYLLLPGEVNILNRKLDERGFPPANKDNPYNFNIGPEHAYLWPTLSGEFKTKPNGQWEEWTRLLSLPLLIGR